MSKHVCWILAGMIAGAFSGQAVAASAPVAKPPLVVGVDANYSLEMEAQGAVWKWNGRPQDLFSGMHHQGVQGLRVRLWAKDDGVNGKAYATEVVQRGIKGGLEPYLVIFLSEDWADLMKQPAPAAWAALPLEPRAEAIRNYSRETVEHFRKNGLTSHFYEIGNEIDYGICGVYPGKKAKKDADNLSKRVWPDAAILIRAAQAGVKEADPEAKFMLHIAHWWDLDFCQAFFQFMLKAGVQLDFAGLSYFPSSNIGGSLTLDQFRSVVDGLSEAIDRPIVIAETGYPSTADFQGQFADWKTEVPGYPLTPEGQEKWIAALLKLGAENPHIARIYYWSPEWYGDTLWKAFALFDKTGEAKPAWRAFSMRDRPSTPPN